MTRVGPFWRCRPNAATTIQDWGWCYYWMTEAGRVYIIEWD
jgi:hypothetical protein